MMKMAKRILFCMVLLCAAWFAGVLADRETLNHDIIRMHVVANSDSVEDQALKLQVRDAVLQGLESDLKQLQDVQAARAYLQENLEKIERIANQVLHAAGYEGDAAAVLKKEAFSTRYYDTFALPAGVYESLLITIGEGGGKNWWCVVFPSLCLPAASENFETVAVGSGFSDSLSKTLEGERGYELRFFLLDALGSMENILFLG